VCRASFRCRRSARVRVREPSRISPFYTDLRGGGWKRNRSRFMDARGSVRRGHPSRTS
jgi:hypothetical protein